MLAHCNTLQHAATHCHTPCNALQHTLYHTIIRIATQTTYHTATRCQYYNTLSYSATHCNMLQHIATYCNTLQNIPQHTATHCNALQRTATHCNNPQYTATHVNTQCNTSNSSRMPMACCGSVMALCVRLRQEQQDACILWRGKLPGEACSANSNSVWMCTLGLSALYACWLCENSGYISSWILGVLSYHVSQKDGRKGNTKGKRFQKFQITSEREIREVLKLSDMCLKTLNIISIKNMSWYQSHNSVRSWNPILFIELP